MRILTVRQPWAWAIIHGGKDVENRSRNIAGSYRGPVAIHAARLDADDLYAVYGAVAAAMGKPFGNETWVHHRGVIIGVVDLVDVHLGIECGCSPWGEPNRWHLGLANPRPLSEPIPYRGALGLREVPADLLARIEAAL